jgi:hypothetical protein
VEYFHVVFTIPDLLSPLTLINKEVIYEILLSRRRTPSAWCWVFPSERLCVDPRSNRTCRHHLCPTTLQRHVYRAVRDLAIPD